MSFRFQQVISTVLVLCAMGYLSTFVERGWVAHDEGLIGQSAERVLKGNLPHVQYRDPYTGGLALFYSAVFRFAGTDLVHVRWILFVAACFAQVLVYSILRRYLAPISAALATCVALVWSFPNYFAGLPSWWLLICAVLALWALLRYLDSGDLRYVAIAGVSVGIAIVIKQTGVYLLVPLILSLLSGTTRSQRFLKRALAASAAAVAALILSSRFGLSEFFYLFLPIGASCFMAVSNWLVPQALAESRRPFAAPAIAAFSALLPVAIFLVPYLTAGELTALVGGALLDPQKRLIFASSPFPPAVLLIPGAMALGWLVWSPPTLSQVARRVIQALRWTALLFLLWFSLQEPLPYWFIWACARGIGALLPVFGLWMLIRRGHVVGENKDLVLILAVLAWLSLNQFPYSSPAYFCYVAPLVVIAGVAFADRRRWPMRFSAAPVICLALLFGVLSLNRGYVYNLGASHTVQDLDTPLDLPRAHLKVSRTDARNYRRVIELIEQHRSNRGLVAGPDTPELYFLVGEFSRSGTLYDFFAPAASAAEYAEQFGWLEADVIVVKHARTLSSPLGSGLLKDLREHYAHGESVGPFEVRWR